MYWGTSGRPERITVWLLDSSRRVNKEHLTWLQIEDLAIRLADRLPRGYDVMLVITRGGMVPACIISERLNLRNILVAAVMFYTAQEHTLDKPIFLQFPADPIINGKRVLIVDDVWDSGRTIMAVRERVLDAGGYPETAVLHYKPNHTTYSDTRPDFYVDETDAWIVYPWDVGEASLPSGVLESISEA
jgi:hypoxanthine phosphoribosyltransferase